MQVADDIKGKVDELWGIMPHTLVHTLGIEFTELSKDRVCGTLPVDSRTHQPFGVLHGGASVALAETLASIGSWLNIDEKNFIAVGLEINANHIKSVQSGIVSGIAIPIHRGQSTHLWDIRIQTDQGALVCVSRLTIAIIKKK